MGLRIKLHPCGWTWLQADVWSFRPIHRPLQGFAWQDTRFKVCALHPETFLLGASGKALSRYHYLDHLIGWGIFPPHQLSIFLFLALPSLPPLCPHVCRETGSFCLGPIQSETISPSFLHPPGWFFFHGNKWNIGKPVLLFVSCSHCHSKWIMIWVLHSIWPFYLIAHLDTWFVNKIKKLVSDLFFQLRQSSFYEAVLQRATIKDERNTKIPACRHQKALERVMSPKKLAAQWSKPHMLHHFFL